MGRPRKAPEARVKGVQVCLPPTTLKVLDTLAKNAGMSRSGYIAHLVEKMTIAHLVKGMTNENRD